MAKPKTSPKSAAKTSTPAPAVKPVLLKVRADGAQDVIATGDFSGWALDKIRLQKVASGEWTTTLELAPGEYQYRLLVDGQWRDDPAAAKRVPNPFGTQNCVIVVT